MWVQPGIEKMLDGLRAEFRNVMQLMGCEGIPLQNWLFTPELQWQFQGLMSILTGKRLRRTIAVA